MTLVAAVMAVSASAQVYVGGGVGIGSMDNGGDNNTTTYKFVPEIGYNFNSDIDHLQIGFRPGVAVNLTPCLSFMTKVGFVGYNHTKNNNTKAKSDGWGVDIDGNNVVFGLYYNF